MVNGVGYGDEFCCNLQPTVVQSVNPSCPGAQNGVVEVQMASSYGVPYVNNGYSALQGIAFQQGTLAPDPYWIWRDSNGVQVGGTTDIMTNLSAGTYTIEIFNCDSDDVILQAGSADQPLDQSGDNYYGCSTPGCSAIVQVTITDPPPITLNFTVTNNNTQTSANDGAIDLSVSGGNGPYTYQWTDMGGNIVGTSQNISGLALGPYYVKVTDNGTTYYDNAGSVTINPGCVETGSAFVLKS